MLRSVVSFLRSTRRELELPAAARVERRRDKIKGLNSDPGIDPAVDAALSWLGRAQDMSASSDGGVARHYSLVSGWSSSYPETTGYIIPTFLNEAKRRGDDSLRERARRMLDWLVSIQLPEGGFQGGMIGETPVRAVTFNTGQILLGLAAGVAELGDRYRPSMRAAADSLVDTQDADGCWRSQSSPFARAGEKVYETHVAWALVEAARLEPEKPYGGAAVANVHWALGWQHKNGWFDRCCLTDQTRPLSHTLGYVLRGILEVYAFSREAELLQAAQRTADGLMSTLTDTGFIPGRLYPDWRPAVNWACLTGSVQIAHCWMILYEITADTRYRDAAYKANRYVRQTVSFAGNPDTHGAVKGSFPVDGGYGQYQYLNWAAKFLIDSNLLEQKLRLAERSDEFPLA